MKIVLIYGMQAFLSSDFSQDIAVIYVENVEFSRDFALQYISNKSVGFFGSLSIFFQNEPDNVYSFSFQDHAVEILKKSSSIQITVNPFYSDLPSLESFLQSKIPSLRLKTEINLPIIYYFVNSFFFQILFLYFLILIVCSYFIGNSFPDVVHKKILINLLFEPKVKP